MRSYIKGLALASCLVPSLAFAHADPKKTPVGGDYHGGCTVAKQINDGPPGRIDCDDDLWMTVQNGFVTLKFNEFGHAPKNTGFYFGLDMSKGTKNGNTVTLPIVGYGPSGFIDDGHEPIFIESVKGQCFFIGGSNIFSAAVISCSFNLVTPGKKPQRLTGNYSFVPRAMWMFKTKYIGDPRLQTATCRGAVQKITDKGAIEMKSANGRICYSVSSEGATDTCKNRRDCEVFGTAPKCGKVTDDTLDTNNCNLVGEHKVEEVRCISSIPANECIVQFDSAIALDKPFMKSNAQDKAESEEKDY